jgi:hypothetical protein
MTRVEVVIRSATRRNFSGVRRRMNVKRSVAAAAVLLAIANCAAQGQTFGEFLLKPGVLTTCVLAPKCKSLLEDWIGMSVWDPQFPSAFADHLVPYLSENEARNEARKIALPHK